jgi:hypothetical protein
LISLVPEESLYDSSAILKKEAAEKLTESPTYSSVSKMIDNAIQENKIAKATDAKKK